MDEAQTNMPEQKPETSVSAKWSFALTFVSFLSISSFIIFNDAFSLIILLTSALVSIILGISGFNEIRKSDAALKGKGLAIAGTTFHSILLILMIVIAVTLQYAGRKHYDIMQCRTHLALLGKSIQYYKNENQGRYPDPNKWCDLLMSECEMARHDFLCKDTGVRYHGQEQTAQPKRCDYAINPNAEPNSRADMVLLFETKPGWNQSGGPEILSTESHKQEGCNILFNDGRVEFVPANQLKKLRWAAEKGANNPDK
jgi:hypothetical protein